MYSESLNQKTEQIFDHLPSYAADVRPGQKTLEEYNSHFQAPLKRARDFGQKLITRRYKYCMMCKYQFIHEHSCTSLFDLQTVARHRTCNLEAIAKHYGFISVHIFLS